MDRRDPLQESKTLGSGTLAAGFELQPQGSQPRAHPYGPHTLLSTTSWCRGFKVGLCPLHLELQHDEL
jgi:hypothetical protein